MLVARLSLKPVEGLTNSIMMIRTFVFLLALFCTTQLAESYGISLNDE